MKPKRVAVALTTAAIISLVGCSVPREPREQVATQRSENRRTGIQVPSPTPTIRLNPRPRARDGSVVVDVVMVNGRTPMHIVDEPEFYTFGIVAPSGAILRPHIYSRSSHMRSPPRFWAPGDSVLRHFDLACGPERSSSTALPCNWAYAFTESGTYKLVARYEADAVIDKSGHLGAAELQLESDTVHISFP